MEYSLLCAGGGSDDSPPQFNPFLHMLEDEYEHDMEEDEEKVIYH